MRTQFQLHQLQKCILCWKQVLNLYYFIDKIDIFSENIPLRNCWTVVDNDGTVDGGFHGVTFKLDYMG